MAYACARNIGERIRRIGHDQYHRARRGVHNARNDLVIDFSILVEQPQPALGIAAVGGAARLFIDAGGNHNQLSIGKLFIVAINNGASWAERRSVTKIGGDRPRPLRRSVHDHNRPGTPPYHHGKSTGTPYPACSNDSDFHDRTCVPKTVNRCPNTSAVSVDRVRAGCQYSLAFENLTIETVKMSEH